MAIGFVCPSFYWLDKVSGSGKWEHFQKTNKLLKAEPTSILHLFPMEILNFRLIESKLYKSVKTYFIWGKYTF